MFTERHFGLNFAVHRMPPMSCQKDLGLIHQATPLFFHLAWMLPLALIVILSTLHSPVSGGWSGCVLEHSKHQTQIGIKSHYFSVGCIMGRGGGGWVNIFLLQLSSHRGEKKSEIWLQHLREASPSLLGMTWRFLACSPRHAAQLTTTNRLLRIHRTVARE